MLDAIGYPYRNNDLKKLVSSFVSTNPKGLSRQYICRKTYRRGKLSTVDPLFKVACFFQKGFFSVLKAADIK